MPICRTCRGEYDQRKALCPVCGAQLGRCVDLCRRCGTDTSEKRLCPRCKSDVGAWTRLDITLSEFILLKGGFLGLLPALLALLLWFRFWDPHEKSLYYYPVLTLASFGISVLLFFVIYTYRLVWWEQAWAAQVYRVRRVPINLLMTVAVLAGTFLLALWVLLYAAAGKPEELLGQGIFAFVYVSSYVCWTMALTLGTVRYYIDFLEKYAPPPIFVNTGRLLQVVVDAAVSDINLPGLAANTPTKCVDTPAVYEVLQTLRIPEDGGIHVLLRECKCVEYPSADGKNQKKLMEMLWRIQADRWGRVQVLRPGSLEPYSVEKRVFREIGRYSY